MPHVFIVDDQHAVLKAVSRILGLSGFKTSSFPSAFEFLASGSANKSGCLVLDLTMPDMDGLALLQEMVKRQSRLPIIFLTGNGDIDAAVLAMKLGAVDFLTKPVNKDKLIAAVNNALEKNKRELESETEILELRKRLNCLTPRERQVINLVASGKLNKQTADELGVAEQTVKIHRARAMTKMKVRTVAELVHLMERISQ